MAGRNINQKTLEEQCERVTSRNDRHYAIKLAHLCRETGTKPAKLVSLGTRLLLEIGTLDLVAKIQRVEDKLDDFRNEFEDAVIRDEE